MQDPLALTVGELKPGQALRAETEGESTERFKAEEAITVSKRRPITTEEVEALECEAPVDDEPNEIWAHTSRITNDEGCVSMPNAKHSIFNVAQSRPGKIHSLETYNSQA